MNRPIDIKDIKQFIGYVSKNIPDNDIRIFRGQQDVSWDIKAAVFRDNYTDRKEKKINEIIRKYNFDEFSNRSSYFDELIQMQHYGIPTRLLDWSYNPLISLYFTVAYEDNSDGYVFQNTIPKGNINSFNSSLFKKLSELFQADVELDVLTFENEKEVKGILIDAIANSKNNYFIDSVLRNNRIRAQQGCFSIKIDKKQKFIDYVLSDIVLIYLREFYSTITIDERVEKLMRHNLKTNSDFKDIISKLVTIYRNKGSLSDYKALFTNYINNIVFNNPEFCTLESISDIEEVLFLNSDDFASFIMSKIQELETNDYELKTDNLIRYRIKKEDKANLKKQLENVGITSTFVYPDIQGTIDHIKNIFK